MESEKKKERTRKRRKTSETPPPPYESPSEDDDDCDNVNASKREKLDFENFYRGLRAQVEQFEGREEDCGREDNENDYNDNDEIFEDNVSILNEIIKINDKITKHKRKELSYYIKLGNLLINLKLRYFKGCCKCTEDLNSDCSTCFSCKRMNSHNIKDFFRDVESVVPYVKSYVNFLITLGKLAYRYEKFMLISCSLTEIQTHMSELKDRMKTDEMFWI